MSNTNRETLEAKLGFGQPVNQEEYETMSPLCFCVNPECQSDLVYPAEYESVADMDDDRLEELNLHRDPSKEDNRWWMLLHCPDCDDCNEGVFSQETADHFSDTLDDNESIIMESLKWISEHRKREDMKIMATQADNFSKALKAGHILPEDF